MNLIIIPAMGLNNTTTVLDKDIFGIEYPMKVDMPLKKETKPN